MLDSTQPRNSKVTLRFDSKKWRVCMKKMTEFLRGGRQLREEKKGRNNNQAWVLLAVYSL